MEFHDNPCQHEDKDPLWSSPAPLMQYGCSQQGNTWLPRRSSPTLKSRSTPALSCSIKAILGSFHSFYCVIIIQSSRTECAPHRSHSLFHARARTRINTFNTAILYFPPFQKSARRRLPVTSCSLRTTKERSSSVLISVHMSEEVMQLVHIHQTKPRSRSSCWRCWDAGARLSPLEAPPTRHHPERHWLEGAVGGAERTVDGSKTHENGFCVCSSSHVFDFFKKVGCGQNIKLFCLQLKWKIYLKKIIKQLQMTKRNTSENPGKHHMLINMVCGKDRRTDEKSVYQHLHRLHAQTQDL